MAAGLAATATSPPVALGLRLGPCSEGSGSKPGFTFLQLQELQQQALIYKYMAAGVPVPLQLVLPIWKSVARSTTTLPSPLRGHQPLPSFMRCANGGLCFDYGSGVDPEPGRCRRTDGKKWRCSRDVVPNQKYCERHMHRGRHRSRKPVENGVSSIGQGSTASLSPAPPLALLLPASPAAATNHPMPPSTSLQLMTAATARSSSSVDGSGASPLQRGLAASPPISPLQLRAST